MDRAAQLRQHSFFEGAGDAVLENVVSSCHWLNAKRGQILISHTEPSTDVFLLISGSLEVEIFTELGRSIFFREVFGGDLVGEIAAIDGKPRSASVIARTDCCVAVLPADKFWDTLRSEPVLVERLLQLLASKIREMTDQIFGLTAFDVPKRIVAELLRMSERDESDPDKAHIQPAPTHEALAARIGTSREAVTRTLGHLAQDGLIQKQRAAITIMSYSRMDKMLPR